MIDLRLTGLILLIILNSHYAYSQDTSFKSPKKAAFLSALIPGSGQIYNKKIWKVPIIYAGLVTTIYFINDNQQKYLLYKEEYLRRIQNENNLNPELNKYTNSNLILLKDHYRRNREISYLMLGLTYIINIVDASVDAHLFDFEITDNISMRLQPSYINNIELTSLSVSLKL